MTLMKTCHACKKGPAAEKSVGRRDVCPSCKADLHCCFNCAFYDRSASKQCREPMAEMQREKAKANFCDYFSFAETRAAAPEAGTGQARAALDALFKK